MVTGGLGGEKLIKGHGNGGVYWFMKLPDMGKERASLTSLNF